LKKSAREAKENWEGNYPSALPTSWAAHLPHGSTLSAAGTFGVCFAKAGWGLKVSIAKLNCAEPRSGYGSLVRVDEQNYYI
jgi:hypothetical protein